MNFFSFFFNVYENTLFEKNVSSITRKIIVCDMEPCHVSNSKTRKVTFIFQKKIAKIHMDSKKSIYLFEFKKACITWLFMGSLMFSAIF